VEDVHRMPVSAARRRGRVISKLYAAVLFLFDTVMVMVGVRKIASVFCRMGDVRMRVRRLRFVVMSMEKSDRRVGEFCMDMRVITTTMCMVECANLRKS